MRVACAVVILLSACDRTQLVASYSVSEALTCTAGEFTLEPVAPDVMLVLDRSKSMTTSFGSSTRWQTLVSALTTVLPPVDSEIAFGLYLFPSASGEQCAVSSTPELYPQVNQVTTLLTRLRTSAMAGGTPTSEALSAAASHLASDRPRAMVLATDGLPNCAGDEATLNTLADLSNEGIPTWVIGIGDDINGDALLDAMAIAGARPPRASANSASELEAAFTAIRDELSTCTFTSPSIPDDGGSIIVTLDGAIVPQDASGVSGWTWTSLERGELTLRGEWCSRSSSTAQVKLTITCAAR